MKKAIAVFLCAFMFSSLFISCKKDDGKNAYTVYDTLSYNFDSAYAYDDATVRTYKDLCDAVVKGREEIRINAGVLDNALQLFYTSFPLSVLVEDIKPSGSAYIIRYKNKETLDDDVYKFIESVNNIKGKCNNENKTVYAIKLYSYLSSSVKISENTGISCFETITKGEGTSFSYANMFEYLLQQNGIKAYHILCEDMGGNSKAISAAELDGKLYYFDLFSEYNDNQGKLLKYFGMTTEDAQNFGLHKFIYTNHNTADDASDLKFEPCRICREWEIDGDNLLITRSDDKIVQVAL